MEGFGLVLWFVLWLLLMLLLMKVDVVGGGGDGEVMVLGSWRRRWRWWLGGGRVELVVENLRVDFEGEDEMMVKMIEIEEGDDGVSGRREREGLGEEMAGLGGVVALQSWC